MARWQSSAPSASVLWRVSTKPRSAAEPLAEPRRDKSVGERPGRRLPARTCGFPDGLYGFSSGRVARAGAGTRAGTGEQARLLGQRWLWMLSGSVGGASGKPGAPSAFGRQVVSGRCGPESGGEAVGEEECGFSVVLIDKILLH